MAVTGKSLCSQVAFLALCMLVYLRAAVWSNAAPGSGECGAQHSRPHRLTELADSSAHECNFKPYKRKASLAVK